MDGLDTAIGQGEWGVAEQCALEVARCHGRHTKGAAASAAPFLCLAQVGVEGGEGGERKRVWVLYCFGRG